MTMPNTGYAPWVLRGGPGITISQTGLLVTISSGAGGGQMMARGTVVGDDTTPTWLGAHPGFADAIIRNAEGDYTLTLLTALAVDDSEVFNQIRTMEARVDDGALTKFTRDTDLTVNVLLQDVAEAATDDGVFSILVVGNPEE